ncbi:MAG TPA: RNA polymerase sigma factor [Gammaproteobacteria bacterium]|nr:RNA polymerase sigma factor [Gammaproteobacteria bacterium]
MKDTRDNAFAELIAPHVDALYRAAYRLAGNRADAEDLFQDTCVRAFANLAELERVDRPKAWLIKVQYRVFLDAARRRRKSPLRPMPGDPDAPSLKSGEPGPDDQTEASLTARRLLAAWPQLEPDQRALLALQAEGYSLAEIAAVTDLSTNVLKARLHRARVRLGKLLGLREHSAALATEKLT